MRWIRLLSALMIARGRSRLPVTGESSLSFRVWLTDIDISIMNHAAILTVMEAGRIDFMVRCGFFQLAKRRKWYFVSAALSVQYFRPLKVFQKATLSTKVFHVEDPWIYIEQKISRNGKDIAFCIVKSKVKKGRETISAFAIIRELGSDELPQEGKELVEAYERSNRMMQVMENSKAGIE